MEIYLYLDEDTFLHRLHPVTKIVCLILLFSAAMISSHPLYLLPLLLLVLAAGALSRSLRNLKRVWPVIVFLAILPPLFWTFFLRRGEHLLLRIGPVPIYSESLLYGIGMGLRLNAMLICGVVFLSCTRIEEFTAGLNRMGLPFPVCFALSLAFRLLPLFIATASTVAQAQKARGLDLESGGLVERVRKHIPLIVPVFIVGVRRADLLAMALESRGFGFTKGRTHYLEFKATWADYAVAGFLLALNSACLTLKLVGHLP